MHSCAKLGQTLGIRCLIFVAALLHLPGCSLVAKLKTAKLVRVTSTLADGRYGIGQIIPIQLKFSKAVIVTGTPTLTLATGSTQATAVYASGTGTTTLTFNYTVASGHTSNDLDYAGTTSLALSGGTIKDADGNAAALTLPSPGATGSLGANKGLVVDGIAPTVSNVTSSTTNGSYGSGQTIAVQVVFSEAVTVTGTPRLTLETGTSDAVVNYTSGSGTTTLTFSYTIASGHSSNDLDYTSTTSLALNGGTIRDATGNSAVLTLASPGAAGSLGANKGLVVDGIAPTVSNVTSSTANGTYGVGQTIAVQIVFSEAVTVTGTPQLTLETGTSDAVVNYTSGTGTTTLTFNYTVTSGHNSSDLDYTATSSLALNSGTIKDAAGNDAVLTLAAPGAAGSLGANKSLVVDTPPVVTNVTSSTANGTYGVGQLIVVQVVFSETVTVTGTPQLTLETGTSDVILNYTSGSGTSTLTFNYAVASGNNTSDLDYTSTTSLASNGGTIKDAANNDAILTLAAPGTAGSLGANKNIVVDTPPVINNVTSSTANGTYGVGQTIAVQVVFSESVTVTGTPRLTLETGTSDAVVNYTSGSGTTTLTFNYTIASGHNSSDLDYTATSSLALNGGTIRDATSNDAVLTLFSPGVPGSLGGNKNLVVDGIAPTVSNVTSSTANGTYGVGQTIAVQVVFSESVTVTGTPRLTLETGTSDAVVNYTSGSGTTTLTFNYTVASGHNSSDLDYTSTTSLALNSGTIKDAAGNDAVLTLASPGAAGSLGANKNLVVDGIAPTVSNVTSSTTNGSYGLGQTIAVQVVFSEAVTVTGTPQLTLETGTSDAVVNYTSGSGTTTLTFNYTIASGHSNNDLDYTSTTSLALNGGTIKDAAGNDAVLTLAAPGAAGSLGANKDLLVETTAPTVSNVTSSTANGSYGIGQTIAVQVVFSEAVTVTGTPRLTLETGTSDAVVNYTSGSGTTTLVFNYTIASGQNSSDLDYTATSSLALNGGTIKDAAGNDAVLTLASPGAAGSLGANKNLVVDGIAPTISNVTSSSADGIYVSGNSISIQVVFSEAVTVTGTPQLTLETGATDAVVDYSSGSGTTTLVFIYTVGSGERSFDLDYAGTTSLALNGGTIRDAVSNNAVLTLPAPGAAGSLGANKALVLALYNLSGAANQDEAGTAISGGGDIDGDGVPDIVVGAYNAAAGGTGRGRAYVYSGADGSVLHTINGTANNARLGWSVANLGDVDGDGRSDFALGEPFAAGGGFSRGKAYVISGLSGAPIHTITGTSNGEYLGYSVAAAGDLDGDGRADFIIASPGAPAGGTARGSVSVYNGVTGLAIHTFDGTEDNARFGVSVAGGVDIDGDGTPDIIVGASDADGAGTDRGQVFVFSGTTGTVIQTVTGTEDDAELGLSVSAISDVDGDGLGDILAGEPRADVGGAGRGKAHLFSGATGAVIHTMTGTEDNAELGYAVDAIGDYDGDGTPDAIVGEPYLGSKGKVYVWSGADGSVLQTVSGTVVGGQLGLAVSRAGDLDGDGRPDFAVGAPYVDAGTAARGRIHVFY